MLRPRKPLQIKRVTAVVASLTLAAGPAFAGGDGGGVNLNIDLSLFIQLGIFFGVFFTLKALVFKPYLDSLDARAAKTTVARSDARDLETRAKSLEARYLEGKATAASRANAERQTLRVDGLNTKDTAVSAARADIGAQVEQTRADIGAQIDRARTQLLGQVDDIARLVVEKVLGRGA